MILIYVTTNLRYYQSIHLFKYINLQDIHYYLEENVGQDSTFGHGDYRSKVAVVLHIDALIDGDMESKVHGHNDEKNHNLSI